MPLGSVPKKGRFQVFFFQSRVRQSSRRGLACERLDVFVQMPSEWRHPHTNHIDIFHRISPWRIFLIHESQINYFA